MSTSVLGRIGSTRVGVWLIGKSISPLQRWVIRTTDGRVTLTRKPVLLLTAIGRRSGQPRTIPLFYLRDGDNLIVCNVRPPGERRNPWPLNVRANPEVIIRIGGVAERRRAREARPEEFERLWPSLVAMWPPYERFFAQTHERAVFVLTSHTSRRSAQYLRPVAGRAVRRRAIRPTRKRAYKSARRQAEAAPRPNLGYRLGGACACSVLESEQRERPLGN
jgi:F420H(2)-dependent quinone reductase